MGSAKSLVQEGLRAEEGIVFIKVCEEKLNTNCDTKRVFRAQSLFNYEIYVSLYAI